MFDWILNTPLNIIKNFFFDVSTFQVDDFLNLFSTINFSYQYLNKAKAYLEPSRTSTTELFAKTFFCKICRSLFLIMLQTGPYPQKQSLGVFCEKNVLKLCSKFSGEYPCQSMIQITLCHGCSSVNLLHIFRTPFRKNASAGLLLYPAS